MKKTNKILVGALIMIMQLSLFNCRMIKDRLNLNKEQKAEANKEEPVLLDALQWAKTKIDLQIGGMESLLLHAGPEHKRDKAIITFEYDKSIIKLISDSKGVILEGLKAGKTILTAINGNKKTSCVIMVSGFSASYQKEPYIYSINNIIQLQPGSQERVSVSLYGGSAEDSQKFNWKNENNSVAEIASNGQFCVIKAKGEGNSKITITHPKASYSYSMLVYSLPETEKATFITTSENVVTLHKTKGEKEISVSMENAPEGFNPSQFKWEIINKDGSNICSIDSNSNKAIIKPLNEGSSIIKVTHPMAAYPLEILVRVIEIVKNVYIDTSSTYIEILGDETKNVIVNLKNNKNEYDVNKFEWNIPNNEVITETHFGNEIAISGKKNGQIKISVTHPMAAYPREIMINVKNQASDAVDISNYITTSQNYIRTKVGAEPIPLDILFKGGKQGDQKNFKWTVINSPKENGKEVIKFETTHGTVAVKSRSVTPTTYEDGKGYITPINEGTAVIQITHPKIIYPTEVLVKVLPETAILEEPLYFIGESLIKILNGQEKSVTVELNGANKKEGDSNNIKWETTSSNISIVANGENAVINAIASGKNVSHIKLSHPKVDNNKILTVLTADTQEELDSMKVLYSYKQDFKINVDSSQTIYADYQGFTDEEINNFSFTTDNPEIIKIDPYIDSISNETYFNMCKITGLKAGVASLILKANIDGVDDLIFNITVFPKGVDLTVQPDEAYLTTFQNVVHFKNVGDSKNVTVTAINIPTSNLSSMSWVSNNTDVIDITANGNTASFIAKKEGEAKVTVSHPNSQNKLTIYVKVGKQFIYNNNDSVYIITDTDSLRMVKGSEQKKITVRLINTDSPSSNFSFSIDKPEIAGIIPSQDGICFVNPKKAGQAMLTVSHPDSKFDKNIIILVANSQEELDSLMYLSTANNVITIAKEQSRNISVVVMNSDEAIIDGYSWESANPAIATANPSGATALIHGNEVGTTKIKVTNSHCDYPLEIIVVCVDASLASLNPYITTSSSVLTLSAKEEGYTPWTTISAMLEGGSELDQQNFSWQVENTDIVEVFGQGASCKLRAIGQGSTRLIISHPKADASSYILLVCDKVIASKCHISVPENIITLKPDSGEKSIKASLINGDIDDKYAFNWYADTYDVIELNYSANVASIKPIGQGQTTLHITHPKAAYEQQIIIKVTEHTEFNFALEYFSVNAGETSFISMHVPMTTIPCHVEYESLNTDLCMIEGTSKVAQITGLKEGNTKVKARLVATKTNIVQAESEMLVNVTPASQNLVYITSPKTIYSIEKNTTSVISANITGNGITITDEHNLKWKSSDPSIISLVGASTTGIATGPQCMLKANKAGECTVTVSHDKANTNLILKIIVPGTGDMEIQLNKTYISLEIGGKSELTARLTNANPEDYKLIEWSIQKFNGANIAEVLGKGQTVAIFARKEGKTVVKAKLPNGKFAECEISIEAARGINFTTQQIVIPPGQSKTVKYSVSPDDAAIDWFTDTDEYFSYTVNEETKELTITGLKNGSGRITATTQYGNRANLIVKCSWEYKFKTSNTMIQASPDDEVVISYDVNPTFANIEVIATNSTGQDNNINYSIDITLKKIKVSTKKECIANLQITATNPQNSNEEIGTRFCKINFFYKDVYPIVDLKNKQGKFSSFKEGQINLGDGESLSFNITPNLEKADLTIDEIIFEQTKTIPNDNIVFQNNTNEHNFSLKSSNDYIKKYYKVKYKPYLKFPNLNNKIYFTWKNFNDNKQQYILNDSESLLTGTSFSFNEPMSSKTVTVDLNQEIQYIYYLSKNDYDNNKNPKTIADLGFNPRTSKFNSKGNKPDFLFEKQSYKMNTKSIQLITRQTSYNDAIQLIYPEEDAIMGETKKSQAIAYVDEIIYKNEQKFDGYIFSRAFYFFYNHSFFYDFSSNPSLPNTYQNHLSTSDHKYFDKVNKGVEKTITVKEKSLNLSSYIQLEELNNEFLIPVEIAENPNKATSESLNYFIPKAKKNYFINIARIKKPSANPKVASTKDNILDSQLIGYIHIKYIHRGNNMPIIKIPVFYEKRECNINQTE